MKKIITAGLLVAGVAFCDVVTDWNAIMLDTIKAEGAHTQSRFAAITHVAMFEAVNSITREYRPYTTATASAWGANPDAAVIVAAHRVLTTYCPTSATKLNVDRAQGLAAIPDGAGKEAGIAVGEAAAAAVLKQRENDGAASPIPYSPPIGVGYWQATPPTFAAPATAHWGKVRPFALASSDQFRPDPPPSLKSRLYARDLNEVKRVGGTNSEARSQDRADLARYMAATSPTQVWNALAVQLSGAEGLTLAENARLFALVNMAVADAAIAVFEAKYMYNYWRPVTAIRAGDTDENSKTTADAGFNTFINTPAYPSYPSGFGALSAAARRVLEQFFGNRGHSVMLPANSALPSMALRYTSLRQLTDDIADARVYAGIHFRFEQEEAEVLGERVGSYVVRNQLRPACAEAYCPDEK